MSMFYGMHRLYQNGKLLVVDWPNWLCLFKFFEIRPKGHEDTETTARFLIEGSQHIAMNILINKLPCVLLIIPLSFSHHPRKDTTTTNPHNIMQVEKKIIRCWCSIWCSVGTWISEARSKTKVHILLSSI